MNFKEIASGLFLEDAKEDKAKRQEAIDTYKKLIKYLEQGGDFEVVGVWWHPLSLTAKLQISDFLERDFRTYTPLEIHLERRKNKVRKANYTGGVTNPDIELKVLDVKEIYDKHGLSAQKIDEMDNDDVKDIIYSEDFKETMRKDVLETLKNERRYLSSFVHEYTHYLDDQRVQGDWYHIQRANIESPDPSDEKLEKYFSDPIEINAFFQGELSDIQERVENDSSWLRDKMENVWDHDFENFKNWFFSERLGEIYDWIKKSNDEKTLRRLVNRLYGYWQEIVEKYNNFKG